MMPRLDSNENDSMLTLWSLETPHKRAKPHPGSIAVFLYPKSGCYGREARPIQYLFTGKSRGSLVAVSNLPATFLYGRFISNLEIAHKEIP